MFDLLGIEVRLVKGSIMVPTIQLPPLGGVYRFLAPRGEDRAIFVHLPHFTAMTAGVDYVPVADGAMFQVESQSGPLGFFTSPEYDGGAIKLPLSHHDDGRKKTKFVQLSFYVPMMLPAPVMSGATWYGRPRLTERQRWGLDPVRDEGVFGSSGIPEPLRHEYWAPDPIFQVEIEFIARRKFKSKALKMGITPMMGD